MKLRSRFSLYALALCLTGCLGAAPAQAASPAWEPVAATSPTNLSTLHSETQRVLVSAEGGTFKLVVHRSVSGSIRTTQGSVTVTDAVAQKGEFVAGQSVTSPSGSIALGTTIAAVSGSTLTLASPAGFSTTGSAGEFVEADMTIATTAAIPVGASAAAVETALNAALPAGATVSVSGGPEAGNESRYHVTFGGTLADQAISAMEVDQTQLTGATSFGNALITAPGGRGQSELVLFLQNAGGATSTSAPTTVTVDLPPGVGVARTPFGAAPSSQWSCPPVPYGTSSFSCTTTETVDAGTIRSPIIVPIQTGLATPGVLPIQIGATGGGASPGEYELPLTVSALPAPGGIQTFTASAYDENGAFDTRAGGHPFSGMSAIVLNTVRNPNSGKVVPAGEFKNIEVNIPPGFLGNPIAVPECPENELDFCDENTVVGGVISLIKDVGGTGFRARVFNVESPLGYPAAFYFAVGPEGGAVPIHAVGSLRSDEDYGLTVGSLETPQIATLFGTFFTFWGTPGDPSHDDQRGGPYTGGPVTAFITSATNCQEQVLHPPRVALTTTFWQAPSIEVSSFADVDPVTGCDQLEFESGFDFLPSDQKADSPASFKTKVTVPEEGLTDPDKLMTPEIKQAVVTLAEGVSLNPSGADGLGACTEEQIGLKGTDFPMPNPMRFNREPSHCPESSKIGTGELKTALLHDPLKGDLYLAAQGEGNPFGSLFAIYLVIEDPRRGIFIKLPGKVEPDPITGQVTVTLDNLPQVPFTRLELTLKGGARSAMASPPICGKYTSSSTATPWSAPESGPPTVSPSSFEVTEGPNGSSCSNSLAARPFDVGFKAGSKDPVAGGKSPFTMQITRPDGNQEIERLEISPPPGFVASLKGIPYCSDAQIASLSSKTGREEQQSPACPAASQVGTTDSGAGAGPNPYYAPGKLYLAGPYKGETLSVLSVTPAVAGPFDLGNVVIRAALKLDPRTARITAISDPIPQVVEGVPLRARDIRINLDRPNWAQNPTNCEAMSVDLTAYGTNGAISKPSNRYQVGGCENLGFKPKLEIHLKGGTKRGDHPALLAVLSTRDGDANIAAAAVTLPPSAFLDQAHIRTVCTRVQFAANACPKGAIYGYGKAVTELLDDPIEGNVYLRSSNNKLPDLVAALKGVANIEAVGRIDSVKGGIRNTFDIIPDAPFDAFTLKMQGGKKGLVVNSQNLCAKAHRATVKLTAQNGRRYNFRPKVIADNCKKAKKGKRHSKRPRG